MNDNDVMGSITVKVEDNDIISLITILLNIISIEYVKDKGRDSIICGNKEDNCKTLNKAMERSERFKNKRVFIICDLNIKETVTINEGNIIIIKSVSLNI